MARSRKISDSKQAVIAARVKRDGGRNIPGPGSDPATNLVMADIAMRAGSHILRDIIERRILGRRYDKQAAREIVANRTLGQNLVRMAAARLATRSVPGALAVSGGLLAKLLYDRARKKRDARRSGDREPLEQSGESDS